MDNSEISKTMQDLTDKMQELKAYIVAYNYVLSSCRSIIEGYFKEAKIIETEMEKTGYAGSNLGKNIALNAKTKLMRELICFMENTLESAKKGEIGGENANKP